MSGMQVYLAGGMHSGWQDGIRSAIPSLQYRDPREHRLLAPEEYTPWDLLAVRQSDVVFAYLEAGNPSGFGLAVEVGYAKALGKTVILVDEQSALGEAEARRLAMLRATADVVFDDMDNGIRFLSRLAAI